jgi:hypothetical protein
MREKAMETVHRHTIPDVFEMPDPRAGKSGAWLAAFAVTAIIVGATLVLVVANNVPDPQLIADR